MSDEKSLVLESQGDAPTSKQNNRPFKKLWLFLCLIVATAWCTQLRSPFLSLSIEERVQKILSQTPLIGMEIEENKDVGIVLTDGLKQTVMMIFPSWFGNSSTTA